MVSPLDLASCAAARASMHKKRNSTDAGKAPPPAAGRRSSIGGSPLASPRRTTYGAQEVVVASVSPFERSPRGAVAAQKSPRPHGIVNVPDVPDYGSTAASTPRRPGSVELRVFLEV